jgi:hypothetical protein
MATQYNFTSACSDGEGRTVFTAGLKVMERNVQSGAQLVTVLRAFGQL